MMINFFQISLETFNLISIMLGMFIGGMMTRVRSLGCVCVYLALLVLAMSIQHTGLLSYMNITH